MPNGVGGDGLQEQHIILLLMLHARQERLPEAARIIDT